MIKRETYMSRIRPFIDGELIKVLTGIRRSGKSVMLKLIQEELLARGVDSAQIISLNFESMSNARLCSAAALHEYVMAQAAQISGRVYLFFDEVQEVAEWEKCVNSFRVELDCDIYITGSMPSSFPASWPPIWQGAMWSSSSIPSRFRSSWSFTTP